MRRVMPWTGWRPRALLGVSKSNSGPYPRPLSQRRERGDVGRCKPGDGGVLGGTVMGHRSRLWRKQFGCGHRGFGRYCHRCREQKLEQKRRRQAEQATKQRQVAEQAEERRLEERWQERQDWLDLYGCGGVDLRRLPKPVVVKARRILAELADGKALGALLGKRMGFDRTLVRVPVGYRYRLLCRLEAGVVRPLRVMSHEAYNRVARNRMKF